MEKIIHEPFRDSFRFLSDNSDGGYAFGRVDSESRGQIVTLCIHAPWAIAFANLEDLLRTAVECYKKSVFPTNGADPIDFEKYFAVARALNPNVGYWRQ